MIKGRLLALGMVLGSLAVASPAQALTLNFVNITGNDATNAAAGESQLKVDVINPCGTDPLCNFATFKFYHEAPAGESLVQMSITDVYFDDGTLLGISSIDDSDAGVSFSEGAAPPNLPGGENLDPAFVTSAGFLADSDPPQLQQNGVHPGESLSITFQLLPTVNFDSVIATLLANCTPDACDNSLRIGMHVQAFESDGDSESFVNAYPGLQITPVPLPAGGILLLSGLFGLLGAGRIRKFLARA